jgi:hypothetical protein
MGESATHGDHDRRERLPWLLLAYAIALAVFLLVPPTIKATVGPPVAFTGQELFDLFTPVVVLPLAWLVVAATGASNRRWTVAFVAIAGLWAGAQGIHLAANAIGDAFPAGAARDAFYATEAGDLDHFLDEDLGHWAWHVAWALLSILLLVRAAERLPDDAARVVRPSWLAVTAGVIHGLTFAIVTTEGGTTALGIPLSLVLLVASAGFVSRRRTHPVIQFLGVSSLATLIASIAWAAANGGQLVEPCHVIGC